MITCTHCKTEIGTHHAWCTQSPEAQIATLRATLLATTTDREKIRDKLTRIREALSTADDREMPLYEAIEAILGEGEE